jgi:adenine-specific DNA-methyltransferase
MNTFRHQAGLLFLVGDAQRRKLTAEEANLLADALRNQQPWLEWAGKRETQAMKLTVDPVALHIHERVSAQAILKVARRQDVARMLFGDPEQEYHEAVQFYQHDVDWTNRMILGDSLQVMSSLARRENLAGKVQMIYMDPPYGIKFKSNFQPEIGNKDVGDRERDLTREPEMVKAFLDTWNLGVHSYLSYLRDRLIVAKELLADKGSIFVQISDENLHRVRNVMDEVFGQDNAVSVITIRKTTSEGRSYLGATADYLLWYARDAQVTKYNTIYLRRTDEADSRYDQALDGNGALRSARARGSLTASRSFWKARLPSGRWKRSPTRKTSRPIWTR